MNAAASPPLRVLALTRDTAFLREIRLGLPLSTLYAQGRVAAYAIVHPLTGERKGQGEMDAADVLMVQRDPGPAAARWLAKRGLPFLLDLDDLLLVRPAHSAHRPTRAETDGLVRLMTACAVLGLSNPRLLAELEARTGQPLAGKARIIPNAMPEPPARIPTGRPTAMVLTSSDRLALLSSRHAVLGAARRVMAETGLPLCLIGHPDPGLAAELPGAIRLGFLDYWRHKYFLATAGPLLALAPLETEADPETLAFIAAKSDVKMVEYAGYGHPGVYSAAPPYTDTDLSAGLVARNTGQAWSEALFELARNGLPEAPAQARAVADARAIRILAPGAWLPALWAARLPRPLALADLPPRGPTAGPVGGDASGAPPHHRLADLVYHGLYARLAPDWLRRRVGLAAERLLYRDPDLPRK